jgi:hypothetical protein
MAAYLWFSNFGSMANVENNKIKQVRFTYRLPEKGKADVER